MRRSSSSWSVVAVAVLAQYSCGDDVPTGPSVVDATRSDASATAVSALHTPNSVPTLVLRTRPAWIPGDPYPVVTVRTGFPVHFNLCRSEDPDVVPDDQPTAGEGDSLNWQFHFGDDGTEPFNQDGTFNAHFAQFCRTEHTFESGTYTVTVSVTDKHLESQSDRVVATARVIERVTVNVFPDAPSVAPICAPVVGSLSGADPTFNRAFCPSGAPPCTVSGAGVGVFYDRISCSLPGGPTTINLVGDNIDTYLFLYAGSFSPGAPLSNLVAANDDSGSQTRSRISGSFGPGNYVFVATSFGPGQTYNYTITTSFP